MPRYCFRSLLCCLLFPHKAFAEPVIHISESNVTYRGLAVNGIEYYQNIKYAHETSGARRFAPPELYKPSPNSIIDATKPGPGCPQAQDAMPPFFSYTEKISEDCLSLRISRPTVSNISSTSKLPVVVWLHGGGVVKGSAYDTHFEPDNLLHLSASIGKPIVYVAINYRLTVFGFPRLAILKNLKSLNVGMRDQRAAFEWIKNNIAAFGGDSDRITAYGLSAGGTFISTHLMAYGGEQGVPFTQAWVMSGPPGTALNMTTNATEIHTKAVAEQLRCPLDDEEETLKCLRDIPMQDLLSTAMTYSVANHPPAGLFTFIPSIDDDFLPDRQSVLYKTGRFVKGVPMVLGWTQDDGAINAGPGHLIQSEQDITSVIQSFAHALTSDQLSALLSHYEPEDFAHEVLNYEARKTESDPLVSVHFFRASQIIRDLLFTCSSIEFGTEMAKRSQELDANFPGVWLYALNQSMLTPIWKAAGMPYVRVSHGSDTNYIFNGVFPEGEMSESDQNLSSAFAQSFIDFAYTGNPSSPSNDGFADWHDIRPQVESASTHTDDLKLNILVVGGARGTGPSSIFNTKQHLGQMFSEGTQHVMDGDIKYEEMSSPTIERRNVELKREKLLQRCEFINSLAETWGN